eukprot:CAMPEP_0170199472 /NCGR_PEP_ID=MMETSP0040_2-20121228/69356_1 /TAXON_ID=641309 /ORGANISM="Lotharella oceanica, Strain CCMP622" /LENGTH=191 /DNA_ID=CAMNT_0010449591 /DNA_START=332 /DNA_END=905 /DNA_ORIENTATION=-
MLKAAAAGGGGAAAAGGGGGGGGGGGAGGGAEDKAAPEVEEYDLGYMMAPLSRQRLELVLAKIIYKYPDELEELMEESRKAVDVGAIKTELNALFSDKDLSFNEAFPQLEHHIKLAKDYALAKDSRNATSILKLVTKAFVSNVVNRSLIPSEDSEERGDFDEFVVMLETAWQDVINKADQKSTRCEDLTEW